MSFVSVNPEVLTSAAADLAQVGSTVRHATAVAAPATTGVVAAAGDEVSAALASLFSDHAQVFQSLSGQAAAFHQQFVQLMSGGAAQYVGTEAANMAQTADSLPAVVPSIGYGNTGTSNWGLFNNGTNNLGIYNIGNFNAGIANSGTFNLGILNTSPFNLNPDLNNVTAWGGIGIANNGVDNLGIANNGVFNVGIYNVGNGNAGLPFASLFGIGNIGNSNAGLFNVGNNDTGIANFGNNLIGVGLTGNNLIGIGPFSVPNTFGIS